MKILGSTKNKITKDRNGENVPHLEINELLLVYCNTGNNNYQLNSRVLYRFVPNKLSGQLLDISLQNVIVLEAFNSEFSYIKVLFTD